MYHLILIWGILFYDSSIFLKHRYGVGYTLTLVKVEFTLIHLMMHLLISFSFSS